MGQGRRHFTDEFKQEAVALLVSSGRPLSGIASELGISPSMRSAADGARHFKKGRGHLLGTAEMRFRLIEDHRDIWPVRVMFSRRSREISAAGSGAECGADAGIGCRADPASRLPLPLRQLRSWHRLLTENGACSQSG
jgi:transposase-like protein